MPNGRVRISVWRTQQDGFTTIGEEDADGAISPELAGLLLEQINQDVFTLMPGEIDVIMVYLVGLPAATDGR